MFGGQKNSRVSEKGFSLVELMIVVAIIGVLAALGLPKFQNFQAKAKQSEAKSNLALVYTLEQSYFGENDTFINLASCGYSGACATNNLGFYPVGKLRYNYSVAGASASVFTATAAAGTTDNIKSGCAATDTWTMDASKILASTTNCANL